MKDPREEFQKEAKEKFIELKEPRRGTALGGTGTGKSKIAIDVIKELKPKKILILVDSQRLRDNTWVETFDKFKAKTYWKKTKVECYQTAYKWIGKKFDLVIADEADFSFTEEYSKFYFNNSYNNLLCLTGFIAEDKISLANTIAPIFIEYSTKDAQDDGLLNKTELIIVKYPLSQIKDIKVEYKDKKTKNTKTFYQSENGMYLYLEKNFQKAMIALQKASTDPKMTRDKVQKLEFIMKYNSRKRKEFLVSLKSSRELTKRIINDVLKEKESKVLVFSHLTEQADLISEHTYHSKNKKDNNNIELLNKGDIRVLGVCKAINRGENLDGVNYAIMESYDGSDTNFQQRHGRLTRLDVEDKAIIYILLPHYYNGLMYKPTQAEVWMKKMVKSLGIKISKEIQLLK